MPSTGLTLTNTFGPLPGPVLLSQLDTNYSQLANVVNSLITQANYYVDSSGAANAITVTVPSPLIWSLIAGVPLQVKIANTNTGAATITVNGGAAQALKNQDGSAMIAGQLKSGGIYGIQYDGTNFQVVSGGVAIPTYPQTAAELAASVTPAALYREPLDPRRYSTIADWSAVYAAISTLGNTYDGWYRGDHAQHPALTNTIVGFQSLNDAQKTGTVSYRNTVFGSQAMQFNGNSVTAGGTNCAFGWASMQNAVECSGNSAFGAATLNSLTGVNSSHNNAFGYRVMTLLVNGTQNNCFGFQTMNTLTDGNNNHCYGEQVLQGLNKGQGNHSFGFQCNYSAIGGSFYHSYGYQSLFAQQGTVVTAITKAASAVITINTVSGTNPFVVGSPIGVDGVVGMVEINGLDGIVTAIGGASGAWTVTTNINSSGFTAYSSSGYAYPSGNTAFGHQTGVSTVYNGGNTIFGWQAGKTNPLDINNTLFGFQAGFRLSTGGSYNVAVGWQALVNSLSGTSNVAVGQQAGTSISSGSTNVAIGPLSANGLSTASNNVQVGYVTGINLNGADNTCVGANAGSQGSAQTYSNTTSVGKDATPTASNQVTLGNTSVATIRAQVTTITAISDARFKKNIKPLDIPDEFLDEVEIVTYEWIASEMPQGQQMGVIAQQLNALQEKYGLQWLGLVDKSNPDRWEATPGKLLFPLILKTQKLARRVAALEGDDQWRKL